MMVSTATKFDVTWKEACCDPKCESDHVRSVTVSTLELAFEIIRSIVDPGTEVTISENFE